MVSTISLFTCVLVVISQTDAFVRREVTPTQGPNVLENLQKNLDDFRRCIDQSLAKSAADINEKQLQPVFTVVGDSLNRVSKAFDDLTTPSKTASH